MVEKSQHYWQLVGIAAEMSSFFKTSMMTKLLDLLRKSTEIWNETHLGCNFTPYS